MKWYRKDSNDNDLHDSLCHGNLNYAIVVKATFYFKKSGNFFDSKRTNWDPLFEDIRNELGLNLSKKSFSNGVSSSKNAKQNPNTGPSLYEKIIKARDVQRAGKALSLFEVWLIVEGFYDEYMKHPVTNPYKMYSTLVPLTPVSIEQGTQNEGANSDDDSEKITWKCKWSCSRNRSKICSPVAVMIPPAQSVFSLATRSW